MIKTKVYAYITKESLYEKGLSIELADKALNMFMHFNEIELEIEVEDSGIVSKVTAVEI